MNVVDYTVSNIALASWVWIDKTETTSEAPSDPQPTTPKVPFDFFSPLRQWLDRVEIKDVKLAHRICKSIPAQCPFERDVKVFGRTLFHIPPMCKLNPLYEEVVALRFRALCYLADECGEDITPYC
ncbi:MAG: Mo-dependent nitrogenase C-terminal domain-containing protein [Cyanosarcina radialis HA8281-LM2]|jgi:hypothetical protein|nr:Mo-dependent nitrogenase C-terminal domain-containing protein [Cyanosarcina radialis HA8281-LM2]